MTASAIARNTLCLAAISAAMFGWSSCASSLAREVVVENGRPTRVLLTQVSNNTVFLLQNASSAESAEFYRDTNARALGKIVPDEQLQALLDVFAEKGMFAAAASVAPPDARDVLAVEHGGKRWIWARRQAGVQAGETSFHEARGYFLEVYNSSTAYRTVDPNAPPDLRAERDRVRTDADAAKNKLQRLEGQPR